jgi:hypothetical protein
MPRYNNCLIDSLRQCLGLNSNRVAVRNDLRLEFARADGRSKVSTVSYLDADSHWQAIILRMMMMMMMRMLMMMLLMVMAMVRMTIKILMMIRMMMMMMMMMMMRMMMLQTMTLPMTMLTPIDRLLCVASSGITFLDSV